MTVCPRLCTGQLDALPTLMMYSFYTAQCCGAIRAPSHCRFAPPLIHFIPNSLAYSVPVFLKRQCDWTLGAIAVMIPAVAPGLRRIVALYHRSPIPYQTH
jgi:hypothetical protein